MKTLAILLAGGSGKRMNLDIPKQYIEIHNIPVIVYSLLAFEKSKVDEIIVVADKNRKDYIKECLIKYNIKKVIDIVEGGKERYNSVYNALASSYKKDYYKNVLVHDSARPMITSDLIDVLIDELSKHTVLTLGVPAKDTIREADSEKFSKKTLDRNSLFLIQTPQAFDYNVLYDSYNEIIKDESLLKDITDDVMVVEKIKKISSKIVLGDYKNIKITTQEDIEISAIYLTKDHRGGYY